LVELLVVIGIISLLAALLLPALNSARKAAQETQCMSNLRQFGFGIQMYVDQFKGAVPQKGPDGSNNTSEDFKKGTAYGISGFDDGSLWFNAIPEYVVGKSYYQMLVDDANGFPAPHAGMSNIFICPTAQPSASLQDVILGDYFMLYGVDSSGVLPNTRFKFACSYVWNSKMLSPVVGSELYTIKMSRLLPASEVVMMVEKITSYGEYTDTSVQNWVAANPSIYGGKITSQGLNNQMGQSKADWTRFTTRHRGGGHLLFADGHVSWYGWTDVQFPSATMGTDANRHGDVVWCVLGPVQ
jgi:prepilin-type processing-associated H-X9-DG protein